ncbi:40061_t:CDS:2, partial [Gigaspora margarita]
MLQISSKIVIGEQVSCKVTVLPKNIILQYIQQSNKSLKNLHLYGWVMEELTEVPHTFQQEQSVKIDQYAIHPTYSYACKINIVSINLASPYTIFHRYLPMNYIEQNIIKSINLCRRKNLNWVDININKYMIWLGLWMSILRFEQIVSHYTLMMPNELEISNSSDLLFLVHSFINAFNTNLNEDKTFADGLTNIIIQLEPCEDKKIEKINMVEKLDSTYGSCVSKVTTIDDVQLIAASLRDRKPQYIIAIASTIAKADEIGHVVKNNTGSTTIKFTKPKVFYEYSQAKGAVDINNQ